ncbi:MAG: ferredoxin [Clostridiales bacterium]|nr:ferredoxin [Clostridiales bacterium]
MIIRSSAAEERALLKTADAICAAVRTAPKACGIDRMDTAIVTGTEKSEIADEMRHMSEEYGDWHMARDAQNIDVCGLVILIGIREAPRGIGRACGLCHFKDCADAVKNGSGCVFDSLDLGIAVGSAAALAADMRIDNRIMFTVGKAAAKMGLLGDCGLIIGLPLSISGKSPFFDRGVDA